MARQCARADQPGAPRDRDGREPAADTARPRARCSGRNGARDARAGAFARRAHSDRKRAAAQRSPDQQGRRRTRHLARHALPDDDRARAQRPRQQRRQRRKGRRAARRRRPSASRLNDGGKASAVVPCAGVRRHVKSVKRFPPAAAQIDPANARGGVPPVSGKYSASSARLVRQGVAATRARPPAPDAFQFRNVLPVPPVPAAGLSDESLVRPALNEAGPLLAQFEVRKSMTWRPVGPAANHARTGKDAVHGDDRTDGQAAWPCSERHGPPSTDRRGAGDVRLPVQATDRTRGRKMTNDRHTPRPAGRDRSDSTHRRSTAHLAAGRHASTGHLSAPGARRIRLIPGHPRRAGAFSLANPIRMGMCTRAPVHRRPIFAY
nr:hypothetical protein [Burkholderia sp. FL-7-2-10-S1-D7]